MVDNKKKKNNKNELTNEEINEIKTKTEKIIRDLEKEQGSLFKSKSNKELISKQIEDLKKYLNEEQFYLLRDKINLLEKMEKEEKDDLEQNSQKEKIVKNKASMTSYVNKIKEFDRWPFYSRIKKICDENSGNEKVQKIAIVITAWVFLLIIGIIGILLIANIIPYNIPQDTTKIGPWIITVLPITILFFI